MRRALALGPIAVALSSMLATADASAQEDRDRKTITCGNAGAHNEAEADCPANTQHAVCQCNLGFALPFVQWGEAKCFCADGGIRPGIDPPPAPALAEPFPASPPDEDRPPRRSSPYERSVSFHWTRLSLTLDLSPIGGTLSDEAHASYSLLARPRVGVEHRANDLVLSWFVSYDASLLSPANFGTILSARKHDGVGLEIGGFMDIDRTPGAMTAITFFQVFGVELRRYGFSNVEAATSLMLRISLPIWHLYPF